MVFSHCFDCCLVESLLHLDSQYCPCSNNILNIIGLNWCGIKKRLNYLEFEQMIRKYDIIYLVETKTDDTLLTLSQTTTFISTNTFIPIIQTNAFFVIYISFKQIHLSQPIHLS
jgi:hypothetical protein